MFRVSTPSMCEINFVNIYICNYSFTAFIAFVGNILDAIDFQENLLKGLLKKLNLKLNCDAIDRISKFLLKSCIFKLVS